MATKLLITEEMIQKVEDEFMELHKKFRPQPMIAEDIRILNHIKHAINSRRLSIVYQNDLKKKRTYRLQMYHQMRRDLPTFRHYYKSKEENI